MVAAGRAGHSSVGLVVVVGDLDAGEMRCNRVTFPRAARHSAPARPGQDGNQFVSSHRETDWT